MAGMAGLVAAGVCAAGPAGAMQSPETMAYVKLRREAEQSASDAVEDKLLSVAVVPDPDAPGLTSTCRVTVRVSHVERGTRYAVGNTVSADVPCWAPLSEAEQERRRQRDAEVEARRRQENPWGPAVPPRNPWEPRFYMIATALSKADSIRLFLNPDGTVPMGVYDVFNKPR